MAVNEQIYGLKSQWIKPFYQNATYNIDAKFRNLAAYFGTHSGSSFTDGMLQTGFVNNKINNNKPIDKSLSYCGIGSELPLSNIRYLNARDGTILTKDSRTVTNWFFYTARNTEEYLRQTIQNGTTSNFNSDKYYRWCPNGSMSGSIHPNQHVEPMTQICIKNFVLLIKVACTDDITSSNPTMHYYDLDDYVANYSETYPYITFVGARPYYSSTDYTNRNTSINTDITLGIGILDSLAVEKYFFDESNNKLNGFTHYNLISNTYRSGLGMCYTLLGIPCHHNGVITKHTNTGYDKYNVLLGDFTILIGDNIRVYTQYSNDLLEKIRQAAAQFGLYFTGDSTVATNGSFTNEKMYIGVLDDNNVTHGKYEHGDKTVRAKQTDWDNTGDSNYDPSHGKPPYDASTTAHRRISPQGVAGRWYCLPLFSTGSEATWFQRIMNIINSTATAEEYNFYGQNPIDCIIEAREVYLPQSFAGWDTTASVIIGDLVINSGELPNVRKTEFIEPINYDCGNVYIDEVYGDFRDYEPYTQMQMYVPFCGIVDLKPSVCVGHNIKLEEEIEFTTGDILANIYIDECLYTTINGNCATDLGINGFAISNYAQIRSSYLQKGASDLLSAASSAVSGIAGGTIAASYGNTAGVKAQKWAGGLTAAQGIVSAIHDVDMYLNLHPAPIKIQNGSPSPQSNSVFKPFIIVQYPLMFDDFDMTSFIRLNGIACYDTGKLSDIAKGITVCSEYDLSGIHCTEEERQMIAHLLESGVIV